MAKFLKFTDVLGVYCMVNVTYIASISRLFDDTVIHVNSKYHNSAPIYHLKIEAQVIAQAVDKLLAGTGTSLDLDKFAAENAGSAV